LLIGDVSALFQVNRSAAVWRAVLAREDWHDRLLHGSDYPLPCVAPLVRLGPLVRAGVLDATVWRASKPCALTTHSCSTSCSSAA
jgi:mannonate dehydratase